MNQELRLVIEISGGVLQEVYNNVNDLEITVVDWDNINDGGDAYKIHALGLKRMPEETAHEADNATYEKHD
jgi:hypothetical protein